MRRQAVFAINAYTEFPTVIKKSGWTAIMNYFDFFFLLLKLLKNVKFQYFLVL